MRGGRPYTFIALGALKNGMSPPKRFPVAMMRGGMCQGEKFGGMLVG